MHSYRISDLNSGANYNFVVNSVSYQLAIDKFTDMLDYENMSDGEVAYFTITLIVTGTSKSFTVTNQGWDWV